MVINPMKYSLEKIPEVPNDRTNQKANKKGSDILKAIEIAKALQHGLGLSIKVQHYPKKKGYSSDPKHDFIFEHGNWMDPGEVIFRVMGAFLFRRGRV